MKKICEQCGMAYETAHCSSGRQRFCSKECSHEWWHERVYKERQNPYVYVCQQCGKTYTAKAKDRAKFCSRECSFEYKTAHAKPKRLCQICKRPLSPKQDKLCSAECWQQFRIQLGRTRCVVCGAELTGTQLKLCGASECRKEDARRESRRIDSEKKPLVERICKQCGKRFVPEYGNKRRTFCSDECNKRWTDQHPTPKALDGKRKASHTRRAKMRGAYVEDISPSAVYDRDDWVCGICGQPIERDLAYPDPGSPTIDHIMPIAKGGKHSYENVQAAHFRCNSLKRDST